MKAIETEYKGILYRSKLEAKWAAYFDLCGARFDYEPQAFDLGDGIKYLPDFCVSDVLSVHGMCGEQTLDSSYKYSRFWFECKGVMSDYDMEKTKRFSNFITDDNEYHYRCPFFVLDRTPIQMFYDFEQLGDTSFEFGPIDGDDEYPFVIGKQSGRNGIGLFGCDSNYISLMDSNSKDFALYVEVLFRWNTKK